MKIMENKAVDGMGTPNVMAPNMVLETDDGVRISLPCTVEEMANMTNGRLMNDKIIAGLQELSETADEIRDKLKYAMEIGDASRKATEEKYAAKLMSSLDAISKSVDVLKEKVESAIKEGEDNGVQQ